MHPDPAFHDGEPALIERIVRDIGFGMVFATTPQGPRVAHTPFILTEKRTLRFHLSRGNALTGHLDGTTALALVNGPDAYVSPRWYGDDPAQVPTWNYVAVEMEGPVRRLEPQGLIDLLEALSAQQEARLPPPAWTMAKAEPAYLDRLLRGIVGFELTVETWRPTLKLSQNKAPAQRQGVIAGLEATGQDALAAWMRDPA